MKKKFTLLIFLLLVLAVGVPAQNLYLKSKDGSIIVKPLESLKAFTFGNNNLLINYLSGPVESYS